MLGVGVTETQIELAARFSRSRRVVLALDRDAAGQGALRRLCADVLPQLADLSGVDTHVAQLPAPFKDAAEFVANKRALGLTDQQIADQFRATVLDRAQPWQDYTPDPDAPDPNRPPDARDANLEHTRRPGTTVGDEHAPPLTSTPPR